jgi:hypothetical protein
VNREITAWASSKAQISPSDPLFNLDKFSVAGRGGKLTNQEMDQILYGRPKGFVAEF